MHCQQNQALFGEGTDVEVIMRPPQEDKKMSLWDGELELDFLKSLEEVRIPP